MIKKLTEFFSPQDFSENPYGWLTNQISHSAVSFFAAYWLGLVPVITFWIIWECYHLSKSKNLKDFLEDLYFEITGAACLITPAISFAILLFLVVRTTLMGKGS